MNTDEVIQAVQAGVEKAPYFCPEWVRHAALITRPNRRGALYDSTAVRFYREVTVRVPTGQLTRFGRPKPQRRRMDLVGLMQPNYRTWEPVVIGVEVKVSEADLVGDEKLVEYLPYCHLFYLAVPAELEMKAVNRIEMLAEGGYVGLLVVEWSGGPAGRPGVRVALQPAKLSTPGDRCLKEVYAELLIKQFSN